MWWYYIIDAIGVDEMEAAVALGLLLSKKQPDLGTTLPRKRLILSAGTHLIDYLNRLIRFGFNL